MKRFKDAKGREWDIQINVSQTKRAREILGVSIAGLAGEGFKPLEDLLNNPEALVDLLFLLVKEQAEKAGVTDIDFGSAFDGDVLQEAGMAFTEELALFIRPTMRETYRRTLEKGKALQKLMAAKAEKHLEKLDLEALATKLIGPLGDAPVSSESTPDPSPSAN